MLRNEYFLWLCHCASVDLSETECPMTPKELPPLDAKYKTASPVVVLLHFYTGVRGYLAAGLGFVVIKHLPYLVAPILTANVINILTNPKTRNLHELWINVGVFFVILVQNIPTNTLANYYLSRAHRAMEARVRGSLIRRLQALSIGFHDTFQSGRLQSKLLADVDALVGLATTLCSGVLMALLNVAFPIGVTLGKKPMLALFFLLTVPLAFLLIRAFRKGMGARTREYRVQVEGLSARLSEMVQMIPITRAHGLEEIEITSMDNKLQEVRTAGVRLDLVNSIFGACNWVSLQTFQLLCLVVTGLMAYKGMIPVGDVVMYYGFFAMIMGSAQMLLGVYPQIARGAEAVRSIGEVLESPDLEHNAGKGHVARVAGGFRFENVEFTYATAHGPALRNLSLDVKAGECVAFVGESGAGKSTILNLIIGFRRPTKGKLFLDGIDMESLDLRQYRRHLAVVTQRTILFTGTIRDNITYGPDSVSQARLDEVLEMSNATEFIRRFPEGLDAMIGEGGKTLSGGQQQRIAIARALIRDPHVIVLDEATSALDVISEFQVQQAIERLIEGRTTFVVAHRLSTIRIADKIVVMKNGEAIEVGTHDELMAKQGEFSRLRKLQF